MGKRSSFKAHQAHHHRDGTAWNPSDAPFTRWDALRAEREARMSGAWQAPQTPSQIPTRIVTPVASRAPLHEKRVEPKLQTFLAACLRQAETQSPHSYYGAWQWQFHATLRDALQSPELNQSLRASDGIASFPDQLKQAVLASAIGRLEGEVNNRGTWFMLAGSSNAGYTLKPDLAHSLEQFATACYRRFGEKIQTPNGAARTR